MVPLSIERPVLCIRGSAPFEENTNRFLDLIRKHDTQYKFLCTYTQGKTKLLILYIYIHLERIRNLENKLYELQHKVKVLTTVVSTRIFNKTCPRKTSILFHTQSFNLNIFILSLN